jgi:NADPH:quinone reductase-like Zn-dependent oxidoreductase
MRSSCGTTPWPSIPADWIIAIMGGLICPWLTYPAVLGSDAAGEVVQAGSAVTRFLVRQAFDYHSRSVVADIIAARRLAIAIAIGTGSAAPCLDIVHGADGRKVLATASQAVSFERLAGSSPTWWGSTCS